MFRHSKIVCTIGPATSTARMIERLIEAGMDVARLNFSHGTHAEHAERIALLREAAMKHQKPIAIHRGFAGTEDSDGIAGGEDAGGVEGGAAVCDHDGEVDGRRESSEHDVSSVAARGASREPDFAVGWVD